MAHGYRPYKSPEGAAAAGTYATLDIGGSIENVKAQITITGTATVVLDASLDSTLWTPVTGSITASTIWNLDPGMPYYRARVTEWASGTVTVAYGPGDGKLGIMQNVSPPIAFVGGPS